MFASRFLKLAILALCIIYVADASRVDNIQVVRREVEVRQNTPGGDASAAPDPAPTKGSDASVPASKDETKPTSAADSKPSDKASASPADSSPAAPEKTTAAPAPSASNDSKDKTSASAQETKPAASKTDSKPSSQPSKSDEAQQTAAPSSSAGSKEDDTKSKSDSKSDKNESSLRPVTSTHIDVVTMTNDDGSKSTLTTTTRTTSTPGLNSGNDGGDNSTMPVKTRNIVIGVVVGVGGSIILGALALVAWRIWGRKKHAEEADGLMAFGDNDTSYQGSSRYPSGGSYPAGYAGVEKSEPPSTGGGSIGPTRSPFQNNDAYHAPGQAPVNASSNF